MPSNFSLIRLTIVVHPQKIIKKCFKKTSQLHPLLSGVMPKRSSTSTVPSMESAIYTALPTIVCVSYGFCCFPALSLLLSMDAIWSLLNIWRFVFLLRFMYFLLLFHLHDVERRVCISPLVLFTTSLIYKRISPPPLYSTRSTHLSDCKKHFLLYAAYVSELVKISSLHSPQYCT